ncbi:hypothetical protein A6R68_15466, partial [Neotoma lepida]
EGIVSPNDLDLVMSDGLGMRYAFIGPLETMHLNAEGPYPSYSSWCLARVEGGLLSTDRVNFKAGSIHRSCLDGPA